MCYVLFERRSWLTERYIDRYLFPIACLGMVVLLRIEFAESRYTYTSDIRQHGDSILSDNLKGGGGKREKDLDVVNHSYSRCVRGVTSSHASTGS